MKVIKYYLNSSKESNWGYWAKIKNNDVEEMPDNWRYALYEITFELVVNEVTGYIFVHYAHTHMLNGKPDNTVTLFYIM